MISLALLLFKTAVMDVKLDIPYKTVDDKPILLDLYLPSNPVRKPVPVVVMIHGGAWISGSKKEMTPLAEALAEKGVAVANVDYRLAPKYKWPAMLDDCRDVFVYLQEHSAEFGIDPNRIGAIGGSAGAHLSMFLGMQDIPRAKGISRVLAVVNVFGPVDLTQDFEKNIANMVSVQVLGKKYEDATEDARKFSPITYIDAKTAPIYTLHGTIDPLVPIIQSERLNNAMKAAKVFHERVVIEGLGHGVSSKDPEVDKKIKTELNKALDWLVSRLKG